MKTACKKRAQTTKIEVKVNIQSPILTALLCCEKMQERMRLCIISITFIFQDCVCFCRPSLHCFHFNDFCTSVAPFTDELPFKCMYVHSYTQKGQLKLMSHLRLEGWGGGGCMCAKICILRSQHQFKCFLR